MTTNVHGLNIYGGKGGSGGEGGQEGGTGGVGQGPTLNFSGSNNIQFGPLVDDYDKLMDFVSPINFFPRQQEIFKSRQKDTGNWLLAHPSFLEWKSGSSKVLWCSGMPGAGKTVLASLVVDHLTNLNNPHTGIACIYFNYKESNIQSQENILGAIWRQLATTHDLEPVRALYKEHSRKGTSIGLQEIHDLLNITVQQYSRAFIVMDALDECATQKKNALLDLVQEIGVKDQIQVLITSRPHIGPLVSMRASILDIQPPQEDIHNYILAQVKKNHRLQRFAADQALREKLLESITSKAAGMFLFVKLQMDLLGTVLTKQALLKALTNLPADINALYVRTFEQIKLDNVLSEIGLSALSWVAFAKRPLTVLELRAALAILSSKPSMPDENSMVQIEDLLEACHGLLVVNTTPTEKIFRLVHYSTQEFMNFIQDQEFPDIHSTIVKTLFISLQWAKDSGHFLEIDHFSWWQNAPKHPLLDYSQYLLNHIKGKPEISLQKELLMAVSNIKQYPTWTIAPWNCAYWPTPLTVLWLAVAGDFDFLVDALLDDPLCFMQAGGAVIVASQYGHLKQLKKLKTGKTLASQWELDVALHQACLGGYPEVVRFLIEWGSAVNSISDHSTPLITAASKGYQEIVIPLLQGDVNPNLVAGRYETALHAAAEAGYKDIVQLLLQVKAVPNLHFTTARNERLLLGSARSSDIAGIHETALYAASQHGHKDIVDLLLQANADPNLVGGADGTALYAAARKGYREIVQLLLQSNADPNIAKEYYGTALYAAVIGRHKDIVEVLLHANTDLNIIIEGQETVLQAAARRGDQETLQMLLQSNADPNILGASNGTALHIAAAMGDQNIVEILLQANADPNIVAGYYGTALQAAAEAGHTSLVQLLLQANADPNIVGGYHGTALQAADRCRGGNTEDITQLLLQAKANPNLALQALDLDAPLYDRGKPIITNY